MKSIFVSLSFLVVFGLQNAAGQSNYVANKGNALLVNFSFGAQMPGGDIKPRFGNNSNLGLGLEFLTDESNWIFGLEGYYIFGSQVKQDVLSTLRTPEGYIIGNDRNIANIQLRERGLYMGALIGKIIPFSETKKRSGLRLTVGMGLLQHKIRIQDDPDRSVPQLLDDYKKGYDRLSNGLALNEFIGYQRLSENKRINFYAGIELTQGFTKNRRDFNFDTEAKDDANRLDFLFGFRIGWVLPFYFGHSADTIYY
ncbi:MAG: hypothetical protein DHS20C18_03070 [Saprospiraceae bacterium]|nr:MAG: hypothetical protein DHS20C18_03070 [Saprospiraceae bacterium]